MRRIALLGAECTGKTSLAGQTRAALLATGASAEIAGEYLREWCDRMGRTPLQSEQGEIAATQRQRIEPDRGVDWLLADSTPLLTAVYSELLFQDNSLYPWALDFQRGFDLNLLCATDLPWLADGFQRSGAAMRRQFDGRLREVLDREGIAYRIIYGRDGERLQQALAGIGMARASENAKNPASAQRSGSAWRWSCEKCSDPDCEHRLFTERLRLKAAGPSPA